MNREEMLELLHGISQPIVTDAIYHDMGCEFLILTKDKGVSHLGANWPAVGPFKMTQAQHSALKKIRSDAAICEDELDENNLKACDLSESEREYSPMARQG